MESHLDEVIRCKAEACRADLPPWPKPN